MDPVIVDLLNWLKENLPPDTNEDEYFKYVRRLQKIFDTLLSLSFEKFYNCATSLHQAPDSTLEEMVDKRLIELKDYLSLTLEKQLRTKKLEASTAKLDLKRQHYELIRSIRLDGCMDLISRYNHLIVKK